MILKRRKKNCLLYSKYKMPHPYSQKHTLTRPVGNNWFAIQERIRLYWDTPTLTIPSLMDGSVEDIAEWLDIVFEEVDNWVIRSCRGLRNFVRLMYDNGGPDFREVIIFDNHNHALYFWIDAIRQWVITSWFELIHIDEHSDLWPNSHTLNRDKALTNEQYAWEFTNLECNVGNYIQPAIQSWLVSKMIRIENEFQIDEYMNYIPSENSVLNIDIDIFAPELDHIPEEKKMQIIKNLLKRVKYVTIATSPYFIDQWRAIEKIRNILP